MKYLFGLLLLITLPVQAQDDAFLSCADIANRNDRLQCLENALNAAVENREAVANPGAVEEAAVGNFDSPEQEAAAAAANPAIETATVDENVEQQPDQNQRRSFLRLPRIGSIFNRDDGEEDDTRERESAQPGEEVAEVAAAGSQVDNFGRETRVVVNENGEDELHDTISELAMAWPNQWLIHLASGQVWRQTTPKRLNLKEGDEVRIYPSRWGSNYRLETGRLHGYIQIERLE